MGKCLAISATSLPYVVQDKMKSAIPRIVEHGDDWIDVGAIVAEVPELLCKDLDFGIRRVLRRN